MSIGLVWAVWHLMVPIRTLLYPQDIPLESPKGEEIRQGGSHKQPIAILGQNEDARDDPSDVINPGTYLGSASVDLAQHRFNAIERLSNERPRNTLGFHTPVEMLSESVASTVEFAS